MVESTYKAKLILSSTDCCGYTTLVFERENYPSPDEQFLMAVMYPNWTQGAIKEGDIGFVTVRYIKAGEDTWYDGVQQVAYKYTNIQFMKFVPLKPTVEQIKLD